MKKAQLTNDLAERERELTWDLSCPAVLPYLLAGHDIRNHYSCALFFPCIVHVYADDDRVIFMLGNGFIALNRS
jgi:hypothetical protein